MVNFGLGVIQIADKTRDFIDAYFRASAGPSAEDESQNQEPDPETTGNRAADLQIVRSYLETFDWNTTGTTIVVCPDSSVVTPKSHGVFQREISLVVVLFKNLTTTGDEQTLEIDELVETLEELNALFCQNPRIADGVDVYSDAAEPSAEGLYSVDALLEGRFLGGIQLTIYEKFNRQ